MVTVTSVSKADPTGSRTVFLEITADGGDTDPAFLVLTKHAATGESASYSDAELTAVASLEDMLQLDTTPIFPGCYRSPTAQLLFPDETKEQEALTALTADLSKTVLSLRASHLDTELWSVSAACTGSFPESAQKLRLWLDRKNITVPETSEMPRYILNMLSVHNRPFTESPEPYPPDNPDLRGVTE